MSEENLGLQYQQFRASARSFDHIAYELENLRMRMSTCAEAEGTCWGSDEIGSAFDKGYAPGAAETMSFLKNAVDRISGIAANIRSNADDYLATERRFQDRLRGIEGT